MEKAEIQDAIHFFTKILTKQPEGIFTSVYYDFDNNRFHKRVNAILNKIDITEDNLTFFMANMFDELKPDLFKHKAVICLIFRIQFIKYQFLANMDSFKQQNLCNFNISTSYPSLFKGTQVRKNVRINIPFPKPPSLQKSYVANMSITGLGILIPPISDIEEGAKVDLSLKIPYKISGSDKDPSHETCNITVCIKRLFTHKSGHFFIGCIFQNLTFVEQITIYQYLIDKKEDLDMGTTALPVMEILKMTKHEE